MADDDTLDLFSWRPRPAIEREPPASPPRRRPPSESPEGEERPTTAQPLSVTQVNNLARNLLEHHFARVMVVGEISNLKRQASGHCYFSLKDRDAQLPAALFRREAQHLTLRLQDGMQVVATGRLTIYGRTGRYQLIVEAVELRGAGALQAAFETLKRKLESEGLFAAARKRPLPRVPGRVAVVTSPSGAVIRDIVNVATRRFPNARILLVPTPVQGAEAASSIAWAIERTARLAPRLGIDVVILARGGGSLEDLWGFNEERVARAICACPIPVVSGVGHETDFTIADFVADHRAPTPSAAAELVFPVRSELADRLRRDRDRGARALRRRIDNRRLALTAARARVGDGAALVREPRQRITELQGRLERELRTRLHRRRLALAAADRRLTRLHPRVHLLTVRSRIAAARGRLVGAARQQLQRGRVVVRDHHPDALHPHLARRLRRDRERLAALEKRLAALSPQRVLERGYSIVFAQDGTAVRDAAAVRSGDPLSIRVARGVIAARVTGKGDVDSGGDGGGDGGSS